MANYKHGGYSKNVWIAIPKSTVSDVMAELEDLEYIPEPTKVVSYDGLECKCGRRLKIGSTRKQKIDFANHLITDRCDTL